MKIVLFALLITSLGTLGCASGGGEEPDGSVTARDSGNLSDRVTSLVDAARDGTVPRDGSISIDARIIDSSVVVGMDAPLGGMCTADTDCPASTDCCFGGLTCVPGTRTGLPSPFNCIPQ